ncbi:hypothetical protein CP863_01445 [Cutibacterium acnes]|uniref:Uncharacterized protein n=1 Tax=Cutibacterium acnes TaxID=1747 RepID=A0AAD0QPG3_CUTAC|nr:hypothetical protein DXN06_06360 [Cutibacterium acnes]PGF33632.1 hypothetical protein B1B10_07435 [Cutibacterium acnes subsp. acnes]QAZ50298.1 hypothetical protein cbac_01630 [Cutibacterium acnes KPA171202]GAE77830.1 hypothetical protein JCM18918_3749 [Cutibacterium acnes JCM 18918]PGF38292.1 hypothetical protein B1B11_02965 [Cutibacterium acnes subsp. acnes]
MMSGWELGTHLDFDLGDFGAGFPARRSSQFCVLTASDEHLTGARSSAIHPHHLVVEPGGV